MLKKICLFIAIATIAGLPCSLYPAAHEATVTEFTIKITKIEVSYDGGNTYQDYYNNTAGIEMNIASVNPSSNVYTFSAVNLPAGTINKVRVTIADQMSFTGYYDSEDQYYAHTAAKTAAYAGLAYPDGTDYATMSATVPTPAKVTVTNMPESVYLAILDTDKSVGGATTIKLNFALAGSIAAVYSAPNTWIYPNELENYCSVE